MKKDKAGIIVFLSIFILVGSFLAYNWYYDNILHDWAYNSATSQRICRNTGLLQIDAARNEPGNTGEYQTTDQLDNPLELIEQWRAEGNLVIH